MAPFNLNKILDEIKQKSSEFSF